MQQNFIETVKQNRPGYYTVKYANGTTEKKRLFVSQFDQLCEFAPRSTRRGFLLTGDIVEITPFKSTKTDVQIFRTFAGKCVTTLKKSGLWSEICRALEVLNSQSDEFLTNYLLADYSERAKIEAGLSVRLGLDSISQTMRKGIKTINYESYDKPTMSAEFDAAIRERKQYRRFWRKNYDNSISCDWVGSDFCAWYSEEYKNCGNGHYYLAIDATHAIFCEDD